MFLHGSSLNALNTCQGLSTLSPWSWTLGTVQIKSAISFFFFSLWRFALCMCLVLNKNPGALTFGSLIHLIFRYDVNVIQVYSSALSCPVVPAPLVYETLFCLTVYSYIPCYNLIYHIRMGLFLCALFCLIDLCVYFCGSTTLFYYSLVVLSWNVPPTSLFFSWTALAVPYIT